TKAIDDVHHPIKARDIFLVAQTGSTWNYLEISVLRNTRVTQMSVVGPIQLFEKQKVCDDITANIQFGFRCSGTDADVAIGSVDVEAIVAGVLVVDAEVFRDSQGPRVKPVRMTGWLFVL